MSLKEKLIKQQVNKICKRYKISPGEAEQRLTNELDSNQELKNLINESKRLKQIYRTRLFKDFIKKVKKEIYYDLRTYQQDAESLVDSHISSRERAPHIENLFAQINGHINKAEVILDIGGGLFPASFPFHKYPNLQYYVWLDKDKRSYQALKKENYKKVVLQNYAIGENEWERYLPDGKSEFDFVFMLKLVPVIARQERELLEELARVPFKQALITGSKEAMVKKIDIEKREDAVINKFIDEAGWKIVKKVDLPNEFGYIVK